ncbi:glycosyltransferase family 2 protein [Gorgonomyces haynaldii]|nr:glycosyltransferase family 2 protein [Gorgonomyces haynaldii]
MIGAVVATLAVGCITLLVLLIAYSPKPEPLEDKYKVYDGKPFPSINDKPEIDISIVVPSYNEEQRLEIMMTEALEYLKSTDLSWEVVIVDDGSKDKTCQVAQSLSKNEDRIRLLKLPKNRGKGGAVQQGVLVSRGREILFVDADGATKFSDLARLRSQLNGGVAIGSRAHMVQSEAVVKRTFVRNFLMRGFHFLVFLFGIRSIKDTQ